MSAFRYPRLVGFGKGNPAAIVNLSYDVKMDYGDPMYFFNKS